MGGALFTKGHKKIGGRKKGSPNRKTLLSAASVLSDAGCHPVAEILRLLPRLKTPAKKIEIYQWLTEWACVKPKEGEENDGAIDVTPDDGDDVTTADLLKLVRKTHETKGPSDK